MSRLTSLLSFLGVFLLVASLPLALMGREPFSLVAALLLIFAPTIGSLLQLALSRSREHDADLDAAGLTRDPAGLALALAKLERRQGRYWEEIFLPGRRMPEPSLLRSHPPTEERIRRLMALAGPTSDIYGEQRPVETGWPPFTASPRFKRLGFWY